MLPNKKLENLKKYYEKAKEQRLGKRIRSNELIRKATNNLNRIKSAKYGFTPNHVEENKPWKLWVYWSVWFLQTI